MPKRKKRLKQKLSELTYAKPVVDKHVLELKKNLREISGILNEKKK